MAATKEFPLSYADEHAGPLGTRHIADAVLNPTIRVASHPGKLLMGVFDGAGSYVEGTVLDRRAGEQGAPVPAGLFPDPRPASAPEAIYAGPLYFHYGHFLIESLARAWYAREHPELPLAWAGAHTWQAAQLKPWQTEILAILGLENPTWIVADPTTVDLLHVPDIGYRYDDWIHPDHAAFLAHYQGPPQEPGNRLWLSRSRVKGEVRDLNAEVTERRLSAAGWTVTHPEILSVRAQLDHLSRAETIAGEEGSAFHTLMLLSDVSQKRFAILRRLGKEHANLHTIGDARGVHQRFHSLENERVLRAEGRVVTKITPNSAEILDLLDVPVASVRTEPSAAERVMLRAIQTLGPRRFLDVGARSTAVVDAVTAPTRVVVSTRLERDPRSDAGSGIDVFELDLAGYLEHFHEADLVFDVIRLDGNGFDDLMAGFADSARLGARGTTWVLGSDEKAERAAVAIRLAHTDVEVERTLIGETTVYLVRKIRDTSAAGVKSMSTEAVRAQAEQIPIGSGGPSENVIHSLARRLPTPVKETIKRVLRR